MSKSDKAHTFWSHTPRILQGGFDGDGPSLLRRHSDQSGISDVVLREPREGKRSRPSGPPPACSHDCYFGSRYVDSDWVGENMRSDVS